MNKQEFLEFKRNFFSNYEQIVKFFGAICTKNEQLYRTNAILCAFECKKITKRLDIEYYNHLFDFVLENEQDYNLDHFFTSVYNFSTTIMGLLNAMAVANENSLSCLLDSFKIIINLLKKEATKLFNFVEINITTTNYNY